MFKVEADALTAVREGRDIAEAVTAALDEIWPQLATEDVRRHFANVARTRASMFAAMAEDAESRVGPRG